MLWWAWYLWKDRVPGGFVLSAQMGEVHTDSGKMLAVPDPQKVWAVASITEKVNFVSVLKFSCRLIERLTTELNWTNRQLNCNCQLPISITSPVVSCKVH